MKTVRFLLPAALLGLASSSFPACSDYAGHVPYASLDKTLSEVSGVAASRRHPGVFWAHNDSGDAPRVFAFIVRCGRAQGLGYWTARGLGRRGAVDWEDISIGPGPDGRDWIYVADVGDDRFRRSRAARECLRIVRFPEPDVEAPAEDPPRRPGRRGYLPAALTQVLAFSYPGGEEYDAESFAVHPRNGKAYLLTKRAAGGALVNRLFSFDLDDPAWTPAPAVDWNHPGKTLPLRLPDPFLPACACTGMAISADGKSLVVRNLERGFVYVLRPGEDFSSIWENRPRTFDAKEKQGEAVSFSADGRLLWTASEISRVLYKLACRDAPFITGADARPGAGSVLLSWETVDAAGRPAASAARVAWGLSSSYGNGARLDRPASRHVLRLTGLQSGRRYLYRIRATRGGATDDYECAFTAPRD